jgi:hypothetical protein
MTRLSENLIMGIFFKENAINLGIIIKKFIFKNVSLLDILTWKEVNSNDVGICIQLFANVTPFNGGTNTNEGSKKLEGCYLLILGCSHLYLLLAIRLLTSIVLSNIKL